jgi:hypothetical protein
MSNEKLCRSKRFTMGFIALLPALTEVANVHGYALAVHGSVQRDIDLIAVPWTEDAKDATTLVSAISSAVGGSMKETRVGFKQSPETKPHGRIAWSIYMAEGAHESPYLDISVMPLVKTCKKKVQETPTFTDRSLEPAFNGGEKS